MSQFFIIGFKLCNSIAGIQFGLVAYRTLLGTAVAIYGYITEGNYELII